MSWPGQPGARAIFRRRRPASPAAAVSWRRAGRSSPRPAWSALPGRAGGETGVRGARRELPPAQRPIPTSGDEPLPSLRRSEAVMLFTERAAAASGTFELTTGNQVAVADLCRRLDGLPLAIELAAVRTRVLTVAQILARLTDRFSLLTGGSRRALPRHQTPPPPLHWRHPLLTD